MKVKINAELCVGCGLCANNCAEVYAMKDDKAVIQANPVPEAAQECARQAKEDCPVDAITIEE